MNKKVFDVVSKNLEDLWKLLEEKDRFDNLNQEEKNTVVKKLTFIVNLPGIELMSIAKGETSTFSYYLNNTDENITVEEIRKNICEIAESFRNEKPRN